jgi:hypothetical protein
MSSVINLPLTRRTGGYSIVCLAGGKPQLLRHPADGEVVAFGSASEAFRFSVSLELFGQACTGVVAAPSGEPLHAMDTAKAAVELLGTQELAA